jgi:flagellin-like hook-associated protein FlgL
VNTDALIWIIVVAVSGVVANIATVIAAFRRRPSADAQFADAGQNQTDHVSIHRRISELRDESDKKYLTKEAFEADRTAARETRQQLVNIMATMNEKLDTYLEMRGEVGAELKTLKAQISELFRRINNVEARK